MAGARRHAAPVPEAGERVIRRPLASVACTHAGCGLHMVRVDDRWQCLSGLHWRRLEDVQAEIDRAVEDIESAKWSYVESENRSERHRHAKALDDAERRLNFWNAVNVAAPAAPALPERSSAES